ncbi:MAG TPA: RDD family protein [Terriglobales bacterium]|nr:RDD family protein [Terriglobales bacterium]
MACPLCGRNRCYCATHAISRAAATSCSSNSSPVEEPSLVDPESWDDSEEQFESSLITSEKPDHYRSISLGHMNEDAERTAQSGIHESVRAELAQARTGIAQRRALERELDVQAGDWRDAISSKLDSYRNRRGRNRLSGNYTMHLDFDRSAGRATYAAATAATAPALSSLVEPQPSVEDEVSPAPEDSAVCDPIGSESSYSGNEEARYDVPEQPEPALEQAVEPVPVAPKRRPQPRIIEFPRLFPVERREVSADELAEPVLDRPRIIDVPEETEQIELPLADIDFTPEQAPETLADIETPIQVAGVSQRIFAALADGLLVLVATAMFAGIVLNVTKGLPSNKLVLGMALMVPCVFWGLYQYLFLVHAAATPGMRMAQLRLACFTGEPTNRRIRRSRALAMLLSCASAGLGLAWAFVDEDTLCWHDKISRTYLTHQ